MDLENKKRLAQLVLRARGKRSQRQFAQDLGVSQGAIQSWESSDAIPGVESLEAIAVSLGLSLEELLASARGMDISSPKPAPKVAEDVLLQAEYLSETEKFRLIKLLVDKLMQSRT